MNNNNNSNNPVRKFGTFTFRRKIDQEQQHHQNQLLPLPTTTTTDTATATRMPNQQQQQQQTSSSSKYSTHPTSANYRQNIDPSSVVNNGGNGRGVVAGNNNNNNNNNINNNNTNSASEDQEQQEDLEAKLSRIQQSYQQQQQQQQQQQSSSSSAGTRNVISFSRMKNTNSNSNNNNNTTMMMNTGTMSMNQNQNSNSNSTRSNYSATVPLIPNPLQIHNYQQQQQQQQLEEQEQLRQFEEQRRRKLLLQRNQQPQQPQQQQFNTTSNNINNSHNMMKMNQGHCHQQQNSISNNSNRIHNDFEPTLFNSTIKVTRDIWREIFTDARLAAENCERPPDDPLSVVKQNLKKELEVLAANIVTRKRTALLRKRSLADYEKALQDVSNDEGAKKALELWRILDETSMTVNSNLQAIRERFEKEHEDDDEDFDDDNNNNNDDDDPDNVPLVQQQMENSLLTRDMKNRSHKTQSKKTDDDKSIAQNVASTGEISVEDAVNLLKLANPREFIGELLPFQKESLAFFLNLSNRGANGILADSMGLGKTAQSISIMVAARHLKRLQIIAHLKKEEQDEYRKRQKVATARKPNTFKMSTYQQLLQKANSMLTPCIVVAPLSTSSSWAQEFQTFAPSLRVGNYGCVDDREAMLAEFFQEKRAAAAPVPKKAPQRRRRQETSSDDDDDDSDDEEDEEDEEETSSDDEEFSEETDSSDRRRRARNRRANNLKAAAAARRQAAAQKNKNNSTASAISSAGGPKNKFGFDVLVMPHHFFSQLRAKLCIKYLNKLCRTPWFYVVIDEAHRIKNDSATLTTTLQQFRSVDHRLVLTGTPLQNSLDELWTLLSFLLPEVFAKGQFVSLFKAIADLHAIPNLTSSITQGKQKSNSKAKNANNSSSANTALTIMEQQQAQASAEERQFLLCRKIHDVLLPLMIRREKKDVIKELPKLSEWYVVCPNASLQEFEANIFLRKNAESAALKSGGGSKQNLMALTGVNEDAAGFADENNEFVVDENNNNNNNNSNKNLSIFTERRLALHPFMLRVPRDVKQSLCNEEVQRELFKASGKFIILDLFLRFIKRYNDRVFLQKERQRKKLATSHQEEENEHQQQEGFTHQHKVLIFSQFSSLLEMVETHVGWGRNWPYLKLDGSTGDRPALIKEFKSNDDQFIFLLTKGAGGVGLNLQSADTVILLDIDYNPTMDSQSLSRAYRVGQRNDVLVLKLISDFPAEKSIMEIASRKQDLENKVILAGKFDTKADDEERDEALRKMVAAEERKLQKKKNNDDEAEVVGSDDDDSDQADDQDEDQSSLNVINTGNHPYQVSRIKITTNKKKSRNTSTTNPSSSTTSKFTSTVGTPSMKHPDFQYNNNNNNNNNFPTSFEEMKQQQLGHIRQGLKKEILRFFPRTDVERKFLEDLIEDEEEEFLDDAVESLWFNHNNNNSSTMTKPDPRTCTIPDCLLLPEGTKWKSGTANLLADFKKKEQDELLAPRAAAVMAGKTLDERRRKIEAGELDEDEDEDDF